MRDSKSYLKHYEEKGSVNAPANEVFDYMDDHMNFAAHMNKASLMMAGSKLETKLDIGKGMAVGSHITMNGKILGMKLFLDEVITKREPPYIKEWETVGKVKLIVIGDYLLGFRLEDYKDETKINVYINYNLPTGLPGKLLGFLFGDVYAKWCVRQMLKVVTEHFK